MTTGPAGGFVSTGIENHPGHGSQKSHGRKGADVRDALAEADSIEELNAAISAQSEGITGEALRVNLAGMDLQVARETGEAVLQGLERFPDAKLSGLTTYGVGGARQDIQLDADAYAVTMHGNRDLIAFNVAESGDGSGYRAQLNGDMLDGHLAVGTPMGVAFHEFGHVVSYHSGGERAAGSVARSAKQPGQSTAKQVSKEISQYASTNRGELAAEAFADVMVNGDNASPLAKDIFAAIEAAA
jgi:hypothetical protein